MTNTIEIDGVIGWDIYPSDISAKLKEFDGEPVEILFSSDGGYISDGLAIFNHIHDYKGKTTAKIIGMAASMASYIPLAADKVIAKSNAVFMIHDALMGLYGNATEHTKAAKILSGFSNLLADIYTKKTGKTREEIRALMLDESYFFGSEIFDAGFVDEIDEIDVEEKSKDEAVSNAMSKIEIASNRIRTKPEDFNKIAAYLKPMNFTTPERPAFSNIHKGEKPMDKKTLKAEYPDVFEAILEDGRQDAIEALKDEYVKEGKAAGVLAERARIAGIEALCMPKEFTAKAKAEDWTVEKSASEYLKAEAKKKKDIAASMESEVSDPLESDAPVEPKEPEAKKVDPVEAYTAEIGKLTEGGIKRTDAIKAIAKSNPELHQAYLNAINGGK